MTRHSTSKLTCLFYFVTTFNVWINETSRSPLVGDVGGSNRYGSCINHHVNRTRNRSKALKSQVRDTTYGLKVMKLRGLFLASVACQNVNLSIKRRDTELIETKGERQSCAVKVTSK